MPPAPATREHADDEQARLLAAGEAALAEHGYDGMRVDDVLERAGLGTRAFYRRFRGKSELFLAVFDREMDQAHHRLRSRVEAMPDPEAAVRAWIAANLTLAFDARLARRTRMFLLEREALAREFPEDVERCVNGLLAPLEAAIAAGRTTGVFPDADPAADARAIHHLCAGLMSDRVLGATRRNRAAAQSLVERFALSTLLGRT